MSLIPWIIMLIPLWWHAERGCAAAVYYYRRNRRNFGSRQDRLSKMNDVDVAPVSLKILCDEPPVAAVGFVLAAQQAGVGDEPP